MIGTCKDCISWGNDEHDYKYTKKTCSCKKMIYGYGGDINDTPDDFVLVEYDEGWGMLTGPDFGCIHYEAKL